ncbi:MAG TPA: VOC family protein [Chitinophagaceae bacterium]|nr:VOC family protein [Chitinophagaceae bacterium]
MKITLVLLLTISTCLFGQNIKPHTIGIVVSDIEKSTKWFENILEIKLYKQMNFPEYDSLKINFLKGDYFQIELMEKKSSFAITKYVTDYSLNRSPLIGFSKVAFSVQDINSTYERIKKFNVTEVLGLTKDKEFNSEYFIIKDLDGNVLQFIQQNIK